MPAPPFCLESGRASLCAYSIAYLSPLGSETYTLSRPRIFHLAPPYSGTTLPETLSNSRLIGSSSTDVKREVATYMLCAVSDFNSISATGMCDKPGQPATVWGVCVCVLSYMWLFATPRTIAHQGPQSMGFPRQEYWSLPCPTPRDLLPTSFVSLLHWQAVDFLGLHHQDEKLLIAFKLYSFWEHTKDFLSERLI